MAALQAREPATTAQSGDMRTPKPPPPTNGKPNPAEGRAGAKAVRVAAKKTPARPDKGHVRDAAAKRRIIADEEDEGRRRRKSGHGSASVDAKRRST
jgi:hypothetical protein